MVATEYLEPVGHALANRMEATILLAFCSLPLLLLPRHKNQRSRRLFAFFYP